MDKIAIIGNGFSAAVFLKKYKNFNPIVVGCKNSKFLSKNMSRKKFEVSKLKINVLKSEIIAGIN